MESIEIQDRRSRLVVIPAVGAGVARYDAFRVDGSATPLLRSWNPAAGADPFSLACNLLVPWSNRISGGGFSYQGRFHPLSPNFAGEKYPLHGNGLQVAWTVLHHSATAITLELRSKPIGPFDYVASVSYELHDGSLTMALAVENQAERSLPYGLGFHPWLPRHPGTCLQAAAATVWQEDTEHLPTREEPVAGLPDWDFSLTKPLPRGWINNGFAGWNRQARIIQPEDGLILTLSASETLGIYQLFSPAADSGFFCFEPVSHLVDAHNLAVAGGLVALEPGESLCASIRLDWQENENN